MNRRKNIEGWSGSYSGAGSFIEVFSESECRNSLKLAATLNQSVNTAGSFQSFGDQIVNTENLTIKLSNFNKLISVDYLTGIFIAESGITMSDILCLTLKNNWIPTSVPGSLRVTLGGAIANNVHGKDSLKYGNFGNCIIWIELMLANGEIVKTSPELNEDLFIATVGGMGLTGIILRAAIKLQKIPSNIIKTYTVATHSIEDTCDKLNKISKNNVDYLQIWVDGMAIGKSMGRAKIMTAKFSCNLRSMNFDTVGLEKSLIEKTHIFKIIPSIIFWRSTKFLFHPPFIGYINYFYWLLAKCKKSECEELFSNYYFFHNNIPNFYSVYKPPGFLEIQALIPGQADPNKFRELISIAQKNGIPPVLCGIKKSIGDPFLISFQGEGTTISFDFPVKGIRLELLQEKMRPLFKKIIEFGGKVNLSKDQSLNSLEFISLYPNLSKFKKIKDKYDVNNLFLSDAYRRLSIHN